MAKHLYGALAPKNSTECAEKTALVLLEGKYSIAKNLCLPARRFPAIIGTAKEDAPYV